MTKPTDFALLAAQLQDCIGELQTKTLSKGQRDFWVRKTIETVREIIKLAMSPQPETAE